MLLKMLPCFVRFGRQMFTKNSILCLFGICLVMLDVVNSVTVDVCIGYEFSATCRRNELIVMEEAEVGRMEAGKCLPDETENIGCRNDILFLTDRWCSGRKQCQFTSPNRDIMDANTECSRDLAVYLSATYKCVSVIGENCNSNSANILNRNSAVLSSHVTDEIGCGSARSPWIIEAKHGQTVEISLLDFMALDRLRSRSLVSCSDIYGFIVEKTLNINQTICGQNRRETLIYKSKTNSVQIHILKGTGMNFLIKYSASGCSDPKPPPRAWYKRNGNEAVIGCEANDKQWRLTCSGSTWQGQVGNCSASVVPVNDVSPKAESQLELSTIVIVAGIIGGTIVLVVAVIVCGVVYIQKYKDRKEKKYNESISEEKVKVSLPSTSLPHCRQISSSVVEGQGDYLEPNSNTETDKSQTNINEPLIHIWETPLPDPTNPHVISSSRQCTVHRKPKEDETLAGSNTAMLKKEPLRTGTSYYSPNTGHKYYVVDRQS